MGAEPVGHLSALVHAALQEHDNQAVRAVKTFTAYMALATLPYRKHTAFGNCLVQPTRIPAQHPFASVSTAHLRVQALGGALKGLWDCPNEAFFASLSSGSLVGAVGKTVRAGVVSLDGQLAIQGIKFQVCPPAEHLSIQNTPTGLSFPLHRIAARAAACGALTSGSGRRNRPVCHDAHSPCTPIRLASNACDNYDARAACSVMELCLLAHLLAHSIGTCFNSHQRCPISAATPTSSTRLSQSC